MHKSTMVLGASPNPDRYSYKAIRMLRTYHHPVFGIGSRKGKIIDVDFSNERPDPHNLDIHTVTLYLNAENQITYYDYIFSLRPKRIIFNPGAENAELEALAKEQNIETQNACTLVLLTTGQY